MKNLIREIHRRSLWQVLGVYLAASWVALQVVGQLAQSVGLPAWVEPFAVVLLVIGLPIVLATAVVQEGVPSAGGSGPAASSPEPTVTDSGTVIPAKPATEAVPAGAHQRLFTWRNAAVGGVLAFTLLAALTAHFLTMRNQGVGPVGSFHSGRMGCGVAGTLHHRL